VAAQGFVHVVSLSAISPTSPTRPRGSTRATCHSRENGSLTLVRNIIWLRLRTSAPRLQCADRTGVALYYPLVLRPWPAQAAAASCTPRQRPQDLWERDNPGRPHA
jgi:hypothetical protein